MQVKWIGAALVVGGCGAFGFKMAQEYMKELHALRQLHQVLEFMQNELRFRLTPLPELVCSAAAQAKGRFKEFFAELGALLDCNSDADAAGCMTTALRNHSHIPKRTALVLAELGASLGCFDLDGQLNALEAARICCVGQLETLEQEREQRVRNYQVLGLCAGGALAILLL